MTMFETLLGFVIVLTVIVTVHEFGHFWVARRMGVRVLRFSIGFGAPLYAWTSRARAVAQAVIDSGMRS